MNNNIEIIKKNCTACRACEQICPKVAIKMKENHEGFLYPVVDKEKCINCGLCLKACHVKNEINNIAEISEKKYLAIKPLDKTISKASTSGGIAQIISNYMIENDGFVIGSIMDEKFYVKHVMAKTKKQLEKFRGSKYVISDTEKTFSEAKEMLENGSNVLYIGTACQISGLKTFLGKEYDNLLTIDIVCHGVPSSKIFQKYIKSLETRYNEKIKEFQFRNKDKTDWGMGYTAKVVTSSNKIKYLKADFDAYYINFLKSNISRECCYSCKYTNISKRKADLTIADYWGIEKFKPNFYDKNGVSLCIINTQKGNKMISQIKDFVEIEETEKEEATSFNGNLKKPSIRPKVRDTIYDGIDELKPEKYIKNKLKIDKNLNILFKLLAPKRLRMIYKKYLKK